MEYNIIGKYNKDCKIFAKTVEEDALKTSKEDYKYLITCGFGLDVKEIS